MVMKVGQLDLPNVFSFSGERYTKWKSEEKNHGSNSLPSTLSSTLTRISSFYPNTKALVTTVAENVGAGGAGAPPLRIATNIHSIKLFNNLIKNTLLASMFCGLVKS